MRRRQLKWLWARLKKLAEMDISREERLMKLGAARSKAPSAWRLVKTDVDKTGALAYSLDRDKLRKVRRREGRYLLRTNLTGDDPASSGNTTFSSLQWRKRSEPEGRPRDPPGLPSRREAHRGPHLRRLPRLLPADHAHPPAARPRPGPHGAQRAREVRRRADDRRASAHHRRARDHPHPLHRTGARTAPAHRPHEARAAGPAAPQNRRLQASIPIRSCSEDLFRQGIDFLDAHTSKMAQSAKTG